MSGARAARTGARFLAVAGVLLAVLAVRAVTASRAELARGDHARERGDLDAAIIFYRRAAQWYAPGNPYVTEALDRLATIATDARASGDGERSLLAWRALRGAILSTRSFYVPHRDRLERAEAAIVEGSAALAEPAARSAARRRAREALELPERPAMLWTILLLAGWLAWTGGAFAFVTLALDEEDHVRARPARLWGTVIVIGFGLFVLGMALA